MRNTIATLATAALLVLVGATIANASGDTITACVNPSGLTFIVEDASECRNNDTILSWSSGGGAGTTFQVVEEELVIQEAGPGELPLVTQTEQVVSCPTGMTAISGSWRIVDLNEPSPVGAFGLQPGYPDGGNWIIQMFKRGPGEAAAFAGNTYLRVVCAS